MLYDVRGKKVEQGEGYLLVYCPAYPEAKTNGYVLEHRLVMANYLGRPLKPEEHVHRKLIPCACGCGEMIWNYTEHGRPKKYVQGHNQRGKSWRWMKNEQK